MAGTGVTVNAVIAGPTHTEGVETFVREMVGDDLPWEEAQAEFMKRHRPDSLIQRLIEPEEIANMVAYLASDLASATTGGRYGWTAGTWATSCREALGVRSGPRDYSQPRSGLNRARPRL